MGRSCIEGKEVESGSHVVDSMTKVTMAAIVYLIYRVSSCDSWFVLLVSFDALLESKQCLLHAVYRKLGLRYPATDNQAHHESGGGQHFQLLRFTRLLDKRDLPRMEELDHEWRYIKPC